MKVSNNPKRDALKALLTQGIDAFKEKTEGRSVKLYTKIDGVVYRMTSIPNEFIELKPDELEHYKKARKVTLDIDR